VTVLGDSLGQRERDDEEEHAGDAEQDESGPVVIPSALEPRSPGWLERGERRIRARRGRRTLDAQGAPNYLVRPTILRSGAT
jgi:hypothetical protein